MTSPDVVQVGFYGGYVVSWVSSYSSVYVLFYLHSFGGGFDFMGDGDKDGLLKGMELALK